MPFVAVSTPMRAGFFGGWEIVLLLAVILIVWGAKTLPDQPDGLRRWFEEFRKWLRNAADEELSKSLRSWANESDATSGREDQAANARSKADELVLWLAQGFDVGRIPWAPGTLGSLVGVLWFAVLLVPGNLWFYVVGTVLGLGLSVWLCGAAERILGRTDPGSVVLDEIAAMPVCFLPWVLGQGVRLKSMPPVEAFFSGNNWLFTALIFALFRVFDVLKPWPVRLSENLPGGWGVTADDFLAAAYVALLGVPFI